MGSEEFVWIILVGWDNTSFRNDMFLFQFFDETEDDAKYNS